ncbi:sugar transferase [Paenibacillus koleovorans]|uniref:sugar transferase n=1 Tax=Paenibacillus koleovorans TaxID=121608 RepID=UPI000FD73048|nr:sugar transferase [Paenibacillus koleovorans]
MYEFWKRGFDIAGAIILLIGIAPIMATVALLTVIKLGRPVLFKQLRPGLHEKPFWIYKFRTMANLYDANGELLPDGMRFTAFGGMIRKLSLDELPQLFNVLKGEMSLIGPRPLLPHYSPYYSVREKLRFTVRPGMTGLAQISGRNHLSWNERLAFDIAYVEKLGWRLDFFIFGKTLLKVLRQEDVVANPAHHDLPLDRYREWMKEGSL